MKPIRATAILLVFPALTFGSFVLESLAEPALTTKGSADQPEALNALPAVGSGSVPVTAGLKWVSRTAPLPGEVEIAQYGEPEDMAAFRSSGILGVRFDPPFDPPYTITRIAFPSLTMNGVPAAFPSVRLCEYEPAAALVNLGAPIFQVSPFIGSADGWNEIPVNLTVTARDKIFYWCVEFPQQPATFPNDHPFLRRDFRDTERGFFAASYNVLPDGNLNATQYNLAVSMFCQLPSTDLIPIASTRNLGANPRDTKFEFTFDRPADVRADGVPIPPHSLLCTELLFRPSHGAWVVVSSVGAGKDLISVDLSFMREHQGFWATRAVDRNGHRSLPSNVTVTGLPFVYREYDGFEPNGRINESTLIEPGDDLNATIYPAGDQDFYAFNARAGDVIEIYATGLGDGINDLDPVLFLYDSKKRLVRSNDNFGPGLDALISHVVPVRPDSRGKTEKFTVQIADARHSAFAPTSAPRFLNPTDYIFYVHIKTPFAVTSQNSAALEPEERVDFTVITPEAPASPSMFKFTIPHSLSGSRMTLRVFDVRGRLVRTILDGPASAGRQCVVWDGIDHDGRRVSRSMYFARLECGSLDVVQEVLRR